MSDLDSLGQALLRAFPTTTGWEPLASNGYACAYRGLSGVGLPILGRVLPFESTGAEHLRRRAYSRLVASKSIVHPNVWPVSEVVEDQNVYWISPWFQTSFAHRPNPISAAKAIHIGRALCDGLSAIHAVGILHLNIHPGNIVLEGDTAARLCDVSPVPEGGARSRRIGSQHELLGADPGYAAPEQMLGKPVSAGTDIYSLATVLYELVAGEPLWVGSSLAEIGLRKTREEVQLPDRFPRALRRALQLALSRIAQIDQSGQRTLGSCLEQVAEAPPPQSLERAMV